MPWPMPCGYPAPACAKASKPVAAFLFLGPTGVGRPSSAKALAESIFYDEHALLRIVSEYGEHTLRGTAGGSASGRMSVTTKAVSSPEGAAQTPACCCSTDRGTPLTSMTSCCKCLTTVASPTARGRWWISCQHHHHRHVQHGFGHHPATAEGAVRRLARATKDQGRVMDVLRGHFRPSSSTASTDHRLPCALGKESATSSACARSRGAQRRQPERDARPIRR